MIKLDFNQVKELLLSSPKKVTIVSHRSPDGDSVGSSLGLMQYLKHKNHFSTVILPDPSPPFLSWMPGFEDIVVYEKAKEKAIELLVDAEVIFCLDFNTPSRMGFMAEAFEKNTAAVIVNIDHHRDPDDFAHFQISDISASSTSQLIYEFVEEVNDGAFLNQEFAACLYTGILTDTGSFRFSSTSPKTHLIASKLLETGIDVNEIYQLIYDNYSADRIKLLGFALKDKLKLYEQFQTAIIDLSEEELSQFSFQKGDTEGLVNYPLSIAWVKMSILLTQKDGVVKMSFRSKGNFSVNQIASKYFSGGGHQNASGGVSMESMQETILKIESILPEFQEQLKASE